MSNQRLKVAVVGAGLAGLSAAWHLLERGQEVVIHDPLGVGGGASGVSTGLLHPFPGKRGLLSWNAFEGMAETEKLLAISEAALGKSVVGSRGIFRPAITEQQKLDFRASCEHPGARWMEIPPFGEGVWIENGKAIHSRLYLQGLWKACAMKGARLIEANVSEALDLDADRIVVAAGPQTNCFTPCRHLPLKKTIGQTLLCRWEKPLPFSLVSQGHITPTEDPAICQVGSTYEHTPAPNPKLAYELLEKAALFYPPAAKFEILEIRSGVRVSPIQGHSPLIEQVAPHIWVFTGLGSRGMLYHALMGRRLAGKILGEI